MGIEEVKTGPHFESYRHDRRELLDHVIVLDERHLERLLSPFLIYYH